ncbi:MAG TPA: hypothetical protein VF725_10585 [Ktedonobacterales bacterium]
MTGLLLWRAIRLRCERCGVGRLFRHGYTMYESCPACGWVFEREQGYWTGSMAINLTVTELLIVIGIFPPMLARAPLPLTIGIGLALAILTPLLFFFHSRALWMAVDFMLHPTPLVSATSIMTVDELRALVSRPASGPAQTFDVDQQQGDIGGGHTGDA